MKAQLALAVFGAFIAAGFVFERRGRQVPVSAATWLPLFWMAICASRSIGQWLTVSSYQVTYSTDAEYLQANVTGSPVDRNVLTLVILLGMVIIWRRGAIEKVLQDNKTVLLFVTYLGLTTLWSESIGVSFRG